MTPAIDPRLWPTSDEALIRAQAELANAAAAVLATGAWSPPANPLIAGCFAAYERDRSGPGQAGDEVWAAAVLWRPTDAATTRRRSDALLRGTGPGPAPRQARDVQAQTVTVDHVAAPYVPGLLARREGRVLADALRRLPRRPDVIMVDATGTDHPRRAGLAIHLGAVLDLPSVGVTHRPLVGRGTLPPFRRGSTTPVSLEGLEVARWVCTRSGARPVLAHAGWRTNAATAALVVLLASTPAARTPVPLQEARRVAREARVLIGTGPSGRGGTQLT
jgi:deoxyribonuclease V